MANHVSATAPHVTNSITQSIRRRAQSIIKDRSIDGETRALVRYGLETNDPLLSDLVRRVDAGETIIDVSDSTEDKIQALADIICRAGDEPSAALLVLMSTLENSTHSKALANLAKHIAFTRCGELNLFGMVDGQIAVVERELLADIS